MTFENHQKPTVCAAWDNAFPLRGQFSDDDMPASDWEHGVQATQPCQAVAISKIPKATKIYIKCPVQCPSI